MHLPLEEDGARWRELRAQVVCGPKEGDLALRELTEELYQLSDVSVGNMAELESVMWANVCAIGVSDSPVAMISWLAKQCGWWWTDETPRPWKGEVAAGVVWRVVGPLNTQSIGGMNILRDVWCGEMGVGEDMF